jgi:hypothetical protein
VDTLKAFIANVRFQLWIRKGEFLFDYRVAGDEWLQGSVLLGFQLAMPPSKVSAFERLDHFKDAWSALVQMYSLRKEAETARLQKELVTLQQRDDESELQFVERAETLWSKLKGSSVNMKQSIAIAHLQRGLSPASSALFAVMASASF